MGGPNFLGGTNSAARLNYLTPPPPFCILILTVLGTQILCYSLDFNAFCMIKEYFSQTFTIYKN